MLYIQQPEVLRVTRHVLAGLALALAVAFATVPVPAGAVTLEELAGLTIQARASYNMRIRRAEGEFTTQATHVMKLKIEPDGSVAGQVNRTVTTPRGPRTRSASIKARIGKPSEAASGVDRLWLIDGDKLVLLRAYEAGGFKGEIEFNGTGAAMTCTYRAPFVREEGKGNIRSKQSVVGGPVTVLSATQKSSDCKVTR